MIEIDRRKNIHQASPKILPSIKSNKLKIEQEAIKKENEMIVERIMRERYAKSKEKMLKESKVYEKYKENLRKIKGNDKQSNKLQIVR